MISQYMCKGKGKMTYEDNQFIQGGHWAGNQAAIELLNVGEELSPEKDHVITVTVE
jgi:hypothetical protein